MFIPRWNDLFRYKICFKTTSQPNLSAYLFLISWIWCPKKQKQHKHKYLSDVQFIKTAR